MPKAHSEYWTAKIARNRARGTKAEQALCADGWQVLVVWECEIAKGSLHDRLTAFLEKKNPRA